MLELRNDIAPEETEATVLAVPTWLVASDLTLEVLGLTVTTGNQVKYLGVWLERNESCRKHLVELQKGAESRVNSLSRLPALKCPTRRKARLYAAPTWAGLIKTKRDKQWLTSASRPALLRIVAAHPTASTPAIEVVAGVPPIMFATFRKGRNSG